MVIHNFLYNKANYFDYFKMGKGHRTCEICGLKEAHCSEKLLFSNFPLEESRCREWLKAVGNEELCYLPIEKLHTQRRVCGNHFRRKDFNKKGSRLKRRAIPTLNLSAQPLTDYQLKEFPLHVAKKDAPMVAFTTCTVKATVTSTVTATLTSTVMAPSTSSVHQKEKPEMNQSQNDSLVEIPSTNLQWRNVLMEISPNVQTSMKRSSEITEKSAQKRKLESLDTMDMSPSKKRIIERLRKTKCSLNSLRKSAALIEKIESPVFKEMVMSALKNQNRKPTGRRWTTKNKISALAVFKRSPRTYRYLQHLIPLPSIKTLHNVLKQVPMETGINIAVLAHLKKISVRKNLKDKYCTIVFDEIALKRRLLYDAAGDKVEGFVDLGSTETRSSELADHALVFMLQGLREKMKQPIAFYFVKGTISSQKLASLIKDVIRAVEETGYTVLATICDQGPTNMGAMKFLKKFSSPPPDENDNYFMCNNKEVFIIYDVPHLFKSIRNNFLNYGELHMNGMKAQWKHLEKVEERNRNLLYLSKISTMHVQPKYRAKMKVKYAAQILSNTVAAVLKLLAQAEKNTEANELMQTGTIVHDLDRLFDMTNGPSCPDDVKKGRRENVSNKTEHVRAWIEYRAKLETVKFINPKGIIAKNVRCINGYVTTLRSFRDIWEKLSCLGFKYLNLRQLNQDALENLFGVIRQHSPTNRNPTCYSFISALKTAIISGLTAPHNRGSNCEKDYKTLLTDFHDIVFEGPQNKHEPSTVQDSTRESVSNVAQETPIPVLSIPEEFENIETDLADIDQQPVVYISGYLASTLLKKHACSDCANCLKTEGLEHDTTYSYIALREWWTDKTSLTYPTTNLCRLVENAIKIFEIDVIPNLHTINITQFTVTLFIARCDDSFVRCEKHKIFITNLIYTRLALLLIRRQCQRININLSLLEENVADANKKAQQQGIAK